MNARYYVPTLNRFASADTIVPNPSNPQSFNRYSYVNNNPIRYTDPTGHNPVCNQGGTICSDGAYDDSLPLVNFSVANNAGVNWTIEEKLTIIKAAMRIDTMFREKGSNFRQVYGGAVMFEKTGQDRWNLGFTKNRNWIQVHSAGTSVVEEGGRWVAHELGHAFTKALYPNTTDDREYGQAVIDLATANIQAKNEYGDYETIAGGCTTDNYLTSCYTSDADGFANRDNPEGSPMEDIADMFSGYIYGFEDNDAGRARYYWMNRHIPGWINLAVTNNTNP